jgi:phosphate transport system protein
MERKHIVKSYDKDLAQLKAMVCDMGTAACQQIEDAVIVATTADNKLAENVIRNDENVNRMQAATEELVVCLLAKRQPVAIDLREIVSALKISSELERIADYAANIAKQVHALTPFSETTLMQSILQMAEIGRRMLLDIISAYREVDTDKAIEVWHRDDAIDQIYSEILAEIRRQTEKETTDNQDYTGLIFSARCCERIGDHITNVAENIYFIKHSQPYIGTSAASVR